MIKLSYHCLKQIIYVKVEKHFLWGSGPEILEQQQQKKQSKIDCWVMLNYEIFIFLSLRLSLSLSFSVCVMYKIVYNFAFFSFPYFH